MALYMPERLLTRAQLGYDILFDIADYQNLFREQGGLTPQEFARRKTQLNTLKKHNLESLLGERFNAEVFQVTYHLTNGQLFNTDHDEPFLEIVKRGQKYREVAGSKEVEREKAEVTGFEKMSRILLDCQGESLSERKVVIISPEGSEHSIYQHNFYDVYSKSADGQITMSRLTCKFNYQQFRQAAITVDPFADLPQNPTDADFLAIPLITYKSLAEIQEILSPQEETLPLNQCQKLLEVCAPLNTNYLEALAAENVNVNQTSKLCNTILNAILNVADDFILKPAMRQQLTELIRQPRALLAPAIEHYGLRQVRPVVAGCGLQSGFSVSSHLLSLGLTSSPWTVAEFGLNNNKSLGEKTLNCQCPFCRQQVEAIITCGKIICPKCGQSAPYEC